MGKIDKLTGEVVVILQLGCTSNNSKSVISIVDKL